MPTGVGPLRVRYRCEKCGTEDTYEGVVEREQHFPDFGLTFQCSECRASGKIKHDGDSLYLTGNFDRLSIENRLE